MSTVQITSVNVNGIRAAVKQRSEHNLGFLPWLESSGSDVVLLQEVRASEKDTLKALEPLLDTWHYVGAPAAAKGRAGVGILSKQPLEDVRIGIDGFDDAGRYIEGRLGEITVASLYLPSGSADTDKQDEKYRFLDSFGPYLERAAEERELMVVGGDWNICHRPDDLKNDRANRKKSGFLPDERAFMDSVFGTFPESESLVEGAGAWAGAVEYQGTPRTPASEPKWFDVARRLDPEHTTYTWWTYRGKAFDTDAGWRIDYQVATKGMLERAQRCWVDKAEAYDLRWSDHSPLTVTYSMG